MTKQAQFAELNGKVATVRDQWGRPLYPSEERSLCMVRNHRHSTTVNGVCMPCQQNTKHTPTNGRRRK